MYDNFGKFDGVCRTVRLRRGSIARSTPSERSKVQLHRIGHVSYSCKGFIELQSFHKHFNALYIYGVVFNKLIEIFCFFQQHATSTLAKLQTCGPWVSHYFASFMERLEVLICTLFYTLLHSCGLHELYSLLAVSI